MSANSNRIEIIVPGEFRMTPKELNRLYEQLAASTVHGLVQISRPVDQQGMHRVSIAEPQQSATKV